MSNIGNFAKGPWHIGGPTRNGLAVVDDGRHAGMFPIKCEYSEAPLVASAPNLYDLLHKSTEILERVYSMRAIENSEDLLEEIDVMISFNKLELAKARGEGENHG